MRQNGVKGLFRGMSATIYREVPAYGGQFFCYEALKRFLTPPGDKGNDIHPSRLLLAGGTAGTFGWILSYPMDFCNQPNTLPHAHPSSSSAPTADLPLLLLFFFVLREQVSLSCRVSRTTTRRRGASTRCCWTAAFVDCWRRTVNEHGWRALWRGFGPCHGARVPSQRRRDSSPTS